MKQIEGGAELPSMDVRKMIHTIGLPEVRVAAGTPPTRHFKA